MKKGWKTFWIVCAALLATGIVLCIMGVILGGTMSAVKTVFGGERVLSWFDEDEEDEELWDEASENRAAEVLGGHEGAQYTGVRELELEITCLEVVIRKGSDSKVTVDIEEVPEDMLKYLTVRRDGEKLSIETEHNSRWETYMKNNTGMITIEIPEYLQEASLSIGAGMMNVEEICAGELEIQVGAGTVNVDHFEASEMELTCGVGEAVIAGDASQKAKVECGIGSVTYYAAGSQSDYDYKLECGIGSLDVGENSYSGLAHEQSISNGTGREMEIECGLGNVTVTFDM